jgi:putative FmdB family regulatory protein
VCKKCGEHLEVVQSFKDDALTVCPSCDGELKKVFGNIGIVFKGSGFYKTDSRSGSKTSAPAAKSENGATADAGSDSGQKTEPAGKSESAKSDSGKSESGKSESGKSEPAKSGSTASTSTTSAASSSSQSSTSGSKAAAS